MISSRCVQILRLRTNDDREWIERGESARND